MKTYLVTGGAGFIGSNYIHYMFKKYGDTIRIINVDCLTVAVTGARALFESNGNRCRPGSVRIKIMPPIQTAGMSKAEQKQLPDAVRQSILAALK